ncbi:hypothetical protein QTG54_015909 [Skeletonema marinoi]|uniref:Leucine-rich repeat domain-containing protein n=1 Tax=Skeletonema marinoi TaxID=267567 RepID=A0AAD9D576_9STRA|nr:hypothetical protein QTG54_015909 [Skeletonema marinoi]
MMAANGWYIYNGLEAVPPGVTRVRIHESVTVIPARAFEGNCNIEELECHDLVKTVERSAFYNCTSLRKVIMPVVEVVEDCAFGDCKALTVVECDKLERIGGGAFSWCKSLTSINLPSAKIVEYIAFCDCHALAKVKFGDKLERIIRGAFRNCTSLEQITIPLKDGMNIADNTFQRCENLKHVDLVEGAVLRDTVDALLLDEWRNDMTDKLDVINQSLPTTPAGDHFYDEGEKARAIRMWISSVLFKIIHYKAQHRSLLNEVATLQQDFPQDIMLKNILPFLKLPSHSFEGENNEGGGERQSHQRFIRRRFR